MTGTLHEDQCTYFIIPRSVLLRMKTFRAKVVKKIKTHILCSVTFSKIKTHILCSVTFSKIKTHFVFSKFFSKMKTHFVFSRFF